MHTANRLTEPQSDKVLAIVKESPIRVAAHDKAGWLALFSRTAIIEDPVGSDAHARTLEAPQDDPVARFYETFIASTKIHFESLFDVVAGSEVARDVVIHTELAHGVKLDVAAYLLYKTVEEDGELRLQRMAAHWNLPSMSWRVSTSGLRGLIAMTGITYRMLRFQGFFGVIGYMRGMFQGIFGRGHATVEKFAAAVRSGDAKALQALFASGDALIEFPPSGEERIVPAELCARLASGGDFRVERPQSSGYVTAFRFAAGSRSGIGFFHFDRAKKQIARARFFLP